VDFPHHPNFVLPPLLSFCWSLALQLPFLLFCTRRQCGDQSRFFAAASYSPSLLPTIAASDSLFFPPFFSNPQPRIEETPTRLVSERHALPFLSRCGVLARHFFSLSSPPRRRFSANGYERTTMGVVSV